VPSTDILPPRIRIPRSVAGRPIVAGETIDVTVSIRHPGRTGLARRDGQWVAVEEPFYLTTMDVFTDDARVCAFAMTAAVSDNPFITFRLRPLEEATLRVVFRNNRGARLEAEHPIRFS
jgi:hypothetical protein